MDCTVNAMERLSAVWPLMGVKHNPGAADVAAAVAWPDARVAGRLSAELADCSLYLTPTTTATISQKTNPINSSNQPNPLIQAPS